MERTLEVPMESIVNGGFDKLAAGKAGNRRRPIEDQRAGGQSVRPRARPVAGSARYTLSKSATPRRVKYKCL